MPADSPLPKRDSAADNPPPGPRDLDAVCRGPLLLIWCLAALWLACGAVLGLLCSVKMHAPGLLSGVSWLTYGRLYPAALNALVYGFAIPAGLGLMLWLFCRLGRVKPAFPSLFVAGTCCWNIGVKLGFLGILAGEGTGFEWLEMPWFAPPILFLAYMLMGLSLGLTFHARLESRLYLSQWFLFAALFWFPWVYSTASLLLVYTPVRGALQALINLWYIQNLVGIVLSFIGLAAVFYFIPRIIGRPLHSFYLALLSFWLLLLFGGWGGIPHSAPFPAWIPSLSTVGAVLSIVPILAVAINVRGTLLGQSANVKGDLALRFLVFGITAYLLAGWLQALTSLRAISAATNLTFFVTAQRQLWVYGFVAMTLFGAVYYILDRLLPETPVNRKWAEWHFRLSAIGLAGSVVFLALGGLVQGLSLQNPEASFLEVHRLVLWFYRFNTIADLLMAGGNLLFAANLAQAGFRFCQAHCPACAPGKAAPARNAEAAS